MQTTAGTKRTLEVLVAEPQLPSHCSHCVEETWDRHTPVIPTERDVWPLLVSRLQDIPADIKSSMSVHLSSYQGQQQWERATLCKAVRLGKCNTRSHDIVRVPVLVLRMQGQLCCLPVLTHPVFERGWADGSLGTMVTWVAKSRGLWKTWCWAIHA